jgi:hypothetical protein
MARIEEHQHEVRQVDDMVGNQQRGSALLIGIEAGGPVCQPDPIHPLFGIT